MSLRLKFRGPAGKQHTASLPTTALVGDLRKEAAMAFSIVEGELEMLLGFPPVVCTADSSTLLGDLVRSGDTIVVRQGTGCPPTQAVSAEAFSRPKRLAVRPRVAPLPAPVAPVPAPMGTPSTLKKVNLFWKVAMDDVLSLKSATISRHCEGLDEVRAPYVCLLFFGGRNEAAAAEKVGLSLSDFRNIHQALSARVGQRVSVVAHSICIHREVVFANVSLPDNLLHHQGPECFTPHIKLRVRHGASGDVVRVALAEGFGINRIDLPEPLSLSGTIQMETAAPLHRSQFGRETRLASEVQGHWVRVKKHSSMNCAVISFPSCAVRDSVLRRCSIGEPVRIHGIALEVKPHMEKQPDGSRVNVPEAIFVGWRQASNYAQRAICSEDLQSLFDQQVDPCMNTLRRDESEQLADAMLRSKVGTISALGEGGMTGLGDILVLRLTRMARSAEVTALLLGSPILDECRLRVTAAGHDIMPPWAGGAKLLVPLHREVVEEADVVLQHFHIVAFSSDIEKLKQALLAMPCRERPKLVQEHTLQADQQQQPDEQPFVVECTLRTDSSIAMSSAGL